MSRLMSGLSLSNLSLEIMTYGCLNSRCRSEKSYKRFETARQRPAVFVNILRHELSCTILLFVAHSNGIFKQCHVAASCHHLQTQTPPVCDLWILQVPRFKAQLVPRGRPFIPGSSKHCSFHDCWMWWRYS